MNVSNPRMSSKEIVEEFILSCENWKYTSNLFDILRWLSIPDNKNDPFFQKNIIKKLSVFLSAQSNSIKNPIYIDNFTSEVTVETIYNQNLYIFNFLLRKQYDYLNQKPLFDSFSGIYLNKYWRIVSIKLLKKIKIEKFSGVQNTNLYNQPLEICSTEPMTGFYRDGYCKTGSEDIGTHTVCTKVTKEFLDFTASKGNDLMTASNSFPGLKDGDHWCLCAGRYKEAKDAGIDLQIKPKASHSKTLQIVDKKILGI